MNKYNFISKIFHNNILKSDRKHQNKTTDKIEDLIDKSEFNYEPIKDFPQVQKNITLSIWYDAEINSGGHESYFSCCNDIPHKELEKALLEVSSKEIVNNFKEACEIGKIDDYENTDNKYYEFSPSLADYIDSYIEKHKEEI